MRVNEMSQSLAYYLKEATRLGSSQFLKAHCHPVLLWPEVMGRDDQNDFQFDTVVMDSGDKRSLDLPAKAMLRVDETLVIEVKKQSGSSRSQLIRLGRTANNDIVIPHKTISKLHAYFQKAAGEESYEIVDAGSTNGTRVNNRRLVSSQGQLVNNGDHIQFGPTVRVIYLTAPGFYEYLQKLLRSSVF
jgi:hypothetical protein